MNCVETAKLIREVLKKEFPFVKFSVRSKSYSGGSSVSVRWTDFPTTQVIDNLVKKYSRVRYDDYTGEILSGGNMFVSTSNDWTKETKELIENTVKNNYTDNIINDHWAYMKVYNDTAEELSNNWINEQKAKLQPKKAAKKETVKTVSNNDAITCEMNLNNDLNGVELKFSGVPSENVRNEMKAMGFKWSKFNKVWYAKQSEKTIMFAESLVSIYADITANIEEVKEETQVTEDITPVQEVVEVVETVLEVEEVTEELTPEYNNDNKIKVKSIQFIWSESGDIEDGLTVSAFAEAENLIKQAAFNAPNDGCYDKTKFNIVWSDGQTYEGRIDIQRRHTNSLTPLKNHIASFANNVINDPSETWYKPETKQQYKHLLETYSLEDEKPITQTKQPAKVLDFTSKFKAKQEQKETEKAMNYFVNDVLPYLSLEDKFKLQEAQSDAKKFSSLLYDLSIKAKASKLKQN